MPFTVFYSYSIHKVVSLIRYFPIMSMILIIKIYLKCCYRWQKNCNRNQEVIVSEKWYSDLLLLLLLFCPFWSCTIICCINWFTSLCKNLFNLLEFLAEAFRCHVHHFQRLTVPVVLLLVKKSQVNKLSLTSKVTSNCSYNCQKQESQCGI